MPRVTNGFAASLPYTFAASLAAALAAPSAAASGAARRALSVSRRHRAASQPSLSTASTSTANARFHKANVPDAGAVGFVRSEAARVRTRPQRRHTGEKRRRKRRRGKQRSSLRLSAGFMSRAVPHLVVVLDPPFTCLAFRCLFSCDPSRKHDSRQPNSRTRDNTNPLCTDTTEN
jgi:hypothetical protein